MNYGSVDKEVITDPAAVAALSQRNAKVVMTTNFGYSYVINPLTVEEAKVCMGNECTFNWHRKEKRPG
jgi:hypothetical protein